jgi:iron complex outermembrane receptor protein
VGGRAALMLQLTDKLTVTPRVVYKDIQVGGYNRVDVFNILANPFTTTRPQVRLGDLQQFTQLEERFEDKYLLADVTINYDFGGVELTAITSYSDRDVLVLRDATQLTGSITGQPGVFAPAGLSEAVFTLNAPLFDETTVETITQEVRLGSTGDNRFDWTVGGFYSDQDRNYGQTLVVAGFTALTGIPTAGVRAPVDNLYFSRVPCNLK